MGITLLMLVTFSGSTFSFLLCRSSSSFAFFSTPLTERSWVVENDDLETNNKRGQRRAGLCHMDVRSDRDLKFGLAFLPKVRGLERTNSEQELEESRDGIERNILLSLVK